MSKFQKTAIILGVVYFVFWLTGFLSDIFWETDWGNKEDFIPYIIKNIFFLIASSCTALLFIFNALHHKSTVAKTAAIIGGVWWLLDVCATISSCVGHYLHYTNDFLSTEIGFISTLSGLIWLIAAIILIITVGFFTDSHRKNKAILISSIALIALSLFSVLFSYFGWYIINQYCFSTISVISHTISALVALATCSLFICAATIKSKKIA